MTISLNNMSPIKVDLGQPLQAKCFDGYYGGPGEWCIPCWQYPVQTTVAGSIITEDVFVAKCEGADEPETVRGYMFWPPPECEQGDCLMKRGFEGLEVYTDTYVHHLQNPEVYANTRAKQICGDDDGQSPCANGSLSWPKLPPSSVSRKVLEGRF